MRRTLALILLGVLLVASVGSSEGRRKGRPARCAGRKATIVGSGKPNQIHGTTGVDVIAGRGGRDVIYGLDGDDLLCGGRGVDVISGGGGRDLLAGGRGSDTLDGDGGDDSIIGNAGDDACFQGAGSGVTADCAPVIAAAGDIACATAQAEYNGGNGTATHCRQRATSDLLLRTNYAAVLALGDLQYDSGELAQFQTSYDPTWGRVKAITRPIPGNHEYYTPNAQGYFDYFGSAAGDPTAGYYSFDVGSWHVVAMNTGDDCQQVGGCATGSPQHQWMVSDLAANTSTCTMAMWHEPRFASRQTSDTKLIPFWDALVADRAELALTGHAHQYERFAPQTSAGVADPDGLRQWVVGTGGRDLMPFERNEPNSEARQDTTFGILELALLADGYAWRFVSEAGAAVPFSDEGSAPCH